MGCQCAHNQGENKSELLNINPNSGIENNFIKDNDNLDLFKSSQSNSVNNNFPKNQENSQITPINNEILKEKINPDPNQIYQNYSQKIFELINKIRQNPNSYADEIENSIVNIIHQKPKDDSGKDKIIYKKRVKVALNTGEPAFIEAAKELRTISSIPPLEFKKDICVPLPEKEEDIKNTNYLKDQVKLIREKYNIDVFYKDLIKDPEVSALLMIVDDSAKNPGKKRQAVLDENFKYIGVSSGFVGKTFIAYFSFSK